MKTIPAGLLAHYQQQVQTIAFCTILSLAARQPRVVNITNSSPGVVTTLWQHRLTTGDIVKFVGIEGMAEVNFIANVNEFYFQVTVLSPTEFEINVDTTVLSSYAAGSNYGQARRVLGFTSFERDLVWNNIRLHAKTGSIQSAASATSEFSVSSRDVNALLDSEQITAQDIEEGLYSGAEYEHFEINYQNISQGRHVLMYGRLGDIKWGDQQFTAEGLGLKSLLNQQQGPKISITCRAQLGNRITDTMDERYGCKVRLNTYTWTANTAYTSVAPLDAGIGSVVKPSVYNGFDYVATIGGQSGISEPVWPVTLGATIADGGVIWTAIDARTKPGTVTSAASRRAFGDSSRLEADGWFTHGLLTFLDGPNAGFSSEVKSYTLASGFVLRDAAYHDISLGQNYLVEVGCDKRVETCIDKFDNVYNFRGEPYIPGVHQQFDFPDAPE